MSLPPELRLSLADRIDRRLAVILGASLAVHIGIAVWAWQGDVDDRVLGVANPPAAQMTQDVYDVTIPDARPVPSQPGVAAPVAPAQVPARIVRPVAPPDRDDALRLASILTDEAPGARGPAGMASRHPGADLARQLDEARTHAITIGDTDHTSRIDDRAHVADGVPAPTVRAPGTIETTHHDEAPPPTRIQITGTHVDTSTTLDADALLGKITSTYMAGLQRCYRLGLAHDASLSGRVQVSFTVDDRGQVADPSAHGVSPEVDGCIENLMQAWRFQTPKDRDGNATEMSFRATVVLAHS